MIRTSQEKAFSTAILTLIMLNIVFWGAIKPTIDTIVKTRKKLAVYKNTLSKLEEKNKKLTELSQEYEDLKPTLRRLDYYYPYNSDFSLIIDNLYRTALSFNFKLKDVAFSEKINRKVEEKMEKKYKYLLPVTFRINISGNRQNLQQFMDYWENMPFSPQFISLVYDPQDTGDNQSISLVFVAYKFKYKLVEKDND